MYYAIGDRTYIHIIYVHTCVRTVASIDPLGHLQLASVCSLLPLSATITGRVCTYAYTCVRDHTSVRYAICVRAYVRTYILTMYVHV